MFASLAMNIHLAVWVCGSIIVTAMVAGAAYRRAVLVKCARKACDLHGATQSLRTMQAAITKDMPIDGPGRAIV